MKHKLENLSVLLAIIAFVMCMIEMTLFLLGRIDVSTYRLVWGVAVILITPFNIVMFNAISRFKKYKEAWIAVIVLSILYFMFGNNLAMWMYG